MKQPNRNCAAEGSLPVKVQRFLKSRGVTVPAFHDPILRLKAAYDECLAWRNEAFSQASLIEKVQGSTEKIREWEDEAGKRDSYCIAVEKLIARTRATTWDGLMVQVELMRYDTEQMWGSDYMPVALIRTIAARVAEFRSQYELATQAKAA